MTELKNFLRVVGSEKDVEDTRGVLQLLKNEGAEAHQPDSHHLAKIVEPLSEHGVKVVGSITPMPTSPTPSNVTGEMPQAPEVILSKTPQDTGRTFIWHHTLAEKILRRKQRAA